MTTEVRRGGGDRRALAGGGGRWSGSPRHPAPLSRPVAMTAAAAGGIALILLSSGPGRGAETWPVPPCAVEGAGLVACVAGKLCVCREAAAASPAAGGGPASTRFRWDCGVLRPGCGSAGSPPATLGPYPYPLPPALSLDRSSTTVTTVTGGRVRVHTGDRGRR